MEPRKQYPSDLSDEEWSYLEWMIPAKSQFGRPPKYPRREILNGILYLVRGGCGWRMIPNDLPNWKTCYHYFRTWSAMGLWQKIHDEVRGWVRYQSGKKKPRPLRLSTRRALKQLNNPEFVAMMLERKLLEENDIYSWTL